MSARLAQQTQKTAGISNGLRTVTVTAVSTAGAMVSINGAEVGPFAYVDGSTPMVGDVVSVFRQDSTWLIMGRATPSGGQWVDIAPANNFTLVAGQRFAARRTADNNVQVYGDIVSGATTGSGTSIGRLPAGLVPAGTVLPILVAFNLSTGVSMWVQTSAAGDLNMHGAWANGNTVQISGLYPLDL